MITVKPLSSNFREGDQVVLAAGTYQGTFGVFVRFRTDANWADIAERNGEIRSHPVAWLGHRCEDNETGIEVRAQGESK